MSEEKYKFKPGDVVRLKGSNLKMTVISNSMDYLKEPIDVPPKKEALCGWFNKNDEYQEEYFYEETLHNTNQKV